MVKSSLKQTAPIPVPHDGPIHNALAAVVHESSGSAAITGRKRELPRSSEESSDMVVVDGDANDSDSSTGGLKGAVELLSRCKREVDKGSGTAVDKGSAAKGNLYTRLVVALLREQQIKGQLVALQCFRSDLLQLEQKRKQQEGESVPKVSDTPGAEATCALYRLLLEASLSWQTSPPFRRTLQSSLNALDECYGDNGNLALQQVCDSVIESIVGPEANSCWKDPLHSLQEALSYKPTQERLMNHAPTRVAALSMLTRMSQNLTPLLQKPAETLSSAIDAWDGQVRRVIQQAIAVTNLVKILLQSQPATEDEESTLSLQNVQGPLVLKLADFCWFLLSDCELLPADSMSTVGVAYGRAVQYGTTWDISVDLTVAKIQATLQSAVSRLGDLQATSVAQGLAATISDQILLFAPTDESSSPLEALVQIFHREACEAADPEVRVAAIKGLRSLISRCILLYDCPTLSDLAAVQQRIRRMAQETVEIVLTAWENPPTRKLGSSISGLFECLVRLLQKFDSRQGDASSTRFSGLVSRILAQPPNRKGRYLALEALLPITGAKSLMEADDSNRLLADLLAGIGDRGHNTAVIADLWSKLLQQRLEEMKRELGIEVAPVQTLSRKKRLKLAKKAQSLASPVEEASVPPPTILLPQWRDIWVPSLAQALLNVETIRRKQVAAFCLPRIEKMVGGRAAVSDGVQAFDALLQEILRLSSDESQPIELPSSERETLPDRVMWAQCEVVRLAASQGLLDSTLDSTKQLRHSVARTLPVDQLRAALTHSSPTIRIAAFQTMEFVAETYEGPNSLHGIHCQLELWKFALPFVGKTEGKEYLALLLQCLLSFLDRLSQTESLGLETEIDPLNPSLPLLYSFVVDSLLIDTISRKSAYPGTVMDKETFTLALLECIVTFVARDHPLKLDSKLLTRTGAVFDRRRSPEEQETIERIRKAVFHREIFASLYCLLHSIWDSSRSSAFHLLASLFPLARAYDISLPVEYTSLDARATMEPRAIFLASSPRQREADTGARILALLYLSLLDSVERTTLLNKLVNLLEQRISNMKVQLASALSDDTGTASGRQLPLAHGIIHSLRLIMTDTGSLNAVEDTQGTKVILERMAKLFCHAIQISLAVVADLREGELVDGMDEGLAYGSTGPITSVAKVKPGSIGANGTFSSVSRTTGEEHASRMASQRIIIGSWLLTKETCNAVATALTKPGFGPPATLVNDAGMLLISTITSLKHTGAAYAAGRALQQLSKMCFNEFARQDLLGLPTTWVSRLQSEIAETDKVRDSTLRRSTGYALGFLSIMRSEVSSRVAPRPLCRRVLLSILNLALPSHESVEAFVLKISLAREDQAFPMFSFLSKEELQLVPEESYMARSRIHALNVLRLIVLDAPLSHEVFPVIGDAIAAAIIGYTDSSWAVRNSSTMVFAAAMLRRIDADKNASNTDTTSSNAITITEFFRTYPALPNFLLAVMKGSASGLLGASVGMSMPPIFPILLLLSRVQPAAASGQDAISQVEPFIPVLLGCLEHRDVFIRKVAARALANLSSNGKESVSSVGYLLKYCKDCINDSLVLVPTGKSGRRWNRLHGALLTIRELVASATDTEAVIYELDIGADVMRVCSFPNGRAQAPPPCVMVALETLAELESDRAVVVGRLQTSFQAVEWLNRNPKQATTIGASELGAVAASVACKSICFSIWNTSEEEGAFDESLTQLSVLLDCSLIDVRLAAAKGFKKSIYDGVDKLVETDSDDGFHTERLVALVELLKRSVEKEINRDDATEDSVGTHPPTLRRLSRCLLECVAACERLTDRLSKKQIHHGTWDLGLAIVKRDTSLQNDLPLGLAPPVIGNACELLSGEMAEPAAARNLDSVDTFVSLVTRLGDQGSAWRLRHSAAVALGTSKILCWRPSESESEQQHHKVSIALAGFQMLQDADVDARYTSSRAFATQFTSLGTNSVPELTLIQAFGSSCTSLKSTEFTERQIVGIIESCASVETKLPALLEELSQSEGTALESKLLNVGSQRSIFEEEDPNSYKERLLVHQLSVLAAIQAGHQVSGESSDRCFKLCHYILSVLNRRLPSEMGNAADMLHEVTRYNSIFPHLHSILLTTTCLLFLGSQDECGVQAMAQAIASSAPTAMHPSIRKALSVLACVKANDSSTPDAVMECCFLIPNSQWKQIE